MNIIDADQGNSQRPSLVLHEAVKMVLQTKMERLMARPIIASLKVNKPMQYDGAQPESSTADEAWISMMRQATPHDRRLQAIDELAAITPEGAWKTGIAIDYMDLWRGKESEIERQFESCLENMVVYLTKEQELLLRRTPREFLELNPRPQAAELLDYRSDEEGRVVELTVGAPPVQGMHVAVAIIPNLVQLQRQLDAVAKLMDAGGNKAMAPLRALLRLGDLPVESDDAMNDAIPSIESSKLDPAQRDAVAKALATPHFGIIQGPPGSGKTTVITEVVRQCVSRGEKVLVVSPTHVAVDNVVEKLSAVLRDKPDTLARHTLPIRFSSRRLPVGDQAKAYWVGPKHGSRNATIVARLTKNLEDRYPKVMKLPGDLRDRFPQEPILSKSICEQKAVICGTPIGILSCPDVGDAAPGTYDLLIVDEVSKMLLPEFLAIAIKARRWVLVGDPEQLPPFMDAPECGATLNGIMSPMTELVCSAAAILEKEKEGPRSAFRMIVATNEPGLFVELLKGHLSETGLGGLPSIREDADGWLDGVVACQRENIDDVFERLNPSARSNRGQNPSYVGGIPLLVENGLSVDRPKVAGGLRLVDERCRAGARAMEVAFNCYHSQPWARRNGQKLQVVAFRNALTKLLPSLVTVRSDVPAMDEAEATREHARLLEAYALMFAVGTVSTYDWLVGMGADEFDVAPLAQLRGLRCGTLGRLVEPFFSTLTTQYRMASAISAVPRRLFYGGKALLDGKRTASVGGSVDLLQVDSEEMPCGESNHAEARFIMEMVANLASAAGGDRGGDTVMIITPYSEQFELLERARDAARKEGRLGTMDVQCLTIDRCQGREASYVFVSLVRPRASAFMDMPKRWNVALTRARKGLALVGDIKAYEFEANRAYSYARGQDRPKMSLLARLIWEYKRNNVEAGQVAA